MLLVKFRRDWADEFDVFGFQLFENKEHLEKSILNLIESKEGFYFGTNEGWEPEELEYIKEDLNIQEISQEEANILTKFFPELKTSGYGNFPL